MELYIKFDERGNILRIAKESYGDDVLFINVPEDILISPEKYRVINNSIELIPETEPQP